MARLPASVLTSLTLAPKSGSAHDARAKLAKNQARFQIAKYITANETAQIKYLNPTGKIKNSIV